MAGGSEVLLLGTVEARRDGAPVALTGSKLQALVAMLALGAPHTVAGDRIIDEVWGDQLPSNPANSLQALVSQIRRLMGSDAVARQGSAYRLLIDPDSVDAIRLERLVKAGRAHIAAGSPAEALDLLETAVASVRGPALGGLHEFEFARRAAIRIDELAVSAQEELIDARLALGYHADALTALNGLIGAHPLRERLHTQLVVALYRSGRQADALRAYQHARSTMIEELGIEPGPVLRDLERAVLEHDPTLDAPAVGAVRAMAPVVDRPEPDPDAKVPDLPADRSRFVGREAELEVLRASLADAALGRGGVALICGEPGIGKTRLVEELAGEASAQGFAVGRGRSHSGRGAPMLWPWTQVLSGLMDRFPSDQVLDALKYGASDLAVLVPAIEELTGSVEPPAAVDPETARFTLVEAVTTFLRRLSRTRPIMIVIEDVQWADAASLDLLDFAGSDVADLKLMILATHRTVDPPVDEEVAEVLSDLARHRWVRRIDLVGLDSPSLSELLATSGRRPDAEALTELQHRTRGNPFFVIETLRLIESSNSRIDAETVRRVVPASVRGVIRRRIARLPRDTVSALSAASVLGHDFELAMAASVADVGPAEMLTCVERAAAAGLLTDSEEGVARFRFSHGLVQETLYHDLGPARRAELHRRAGQALERRHGSSPGYHLLALAEHWHHAVPAAPPTKGIGYARHAAAWALATLDHQQAELQLRTALDLVGTMPAGPARFELELDILDQQALLAASALTSYRADELAASVARTRELCAALGDPGRLVLSLWRKATFHLMRAEIRAGALVGEELLRLAEGSGDAGAQLAGHMCLGVVQTHGGDAAAARPHLDRAIELCEAGHAGIPGLVEEPEVFTRAFSAVDHWLLGDDAAADDDVARARAVAARGDPSGYSMTLAMWAASMIAVLRRDAGLARARCEEGAAHALAHGLPVGAHVQSALGGWAIAAESDVDRGLTEIVDHADALGSVRPAYLRPWFLALHADACLMGGRFDEVLRSVDNALAVAEETGERWCRPELLRLRAEARAAIDPADPSVVEDLRESHRSATAQGAVAWLRRTERSLAELAAP